MSKVCSAGVRGSYSYVILNTNEGVIASIHDHSDREIKTTHLAMDAAERWTNKILETKDTYEVE